MTLEVRVMHAWYATSASLTHTALRQVINLAHRDDRRRHMRSFCDSQGFVDVRFFKAIDCKALLKNGGRSYRVCPKKRVCQI